MINAIFKKAFVVIVAFFVIYGQTFVFFPIGVGKIVIGLFFPFFLFWIYCDFKQSRGMFATSTLRVLFLWFIVFFFSIFSTIFNGTYNFDPTSFYYVIILHITEFFIGSYILSKLIKKFYANTVRSMLIVVSIAVSLQALLIVCSFFSVPLKEFINQILPISGNIPEDDILRMRGFTNSGGASLSVVQAIGFLFSMILSVESKKSYQKILFVVLMILQFFSVVLVGRSGLIAIAVFLFSFPIIFYKKSVFSVFTKFNKYLFSILLSFCLIALIGFNQLDPKFRDIVEDQLLEFAFEPFVKGFDGKQSSSQEELSTMFKMPDNVKTWIFGDGEYVMPDGLNYKGTDSGYMKTLYYFGLLGSFLVYFYLGYIMYITIKNLRYPVYKRTIFILILFLLIFQIKEPFLFKPEISKLLFLFFFTALEVKGNKQKNSATFRKLGI